MTSLRLKPNSYGELDTVEDLESTVTVSRLDQIDTEIIATLEK